MKRKLVYAGHSLGNHAANLTRSGFERYLIVGKSGENSQFQRVMTELFRD